MTATGSGKANGDPQPGQDVPGALAHEAARVGTVAELAELAGLLRGLRRRHARRCRDSELSYRELAARTGWSHAAIAQYLTGKTLPPTDRLDGLLKVLGASAAELGAVATARDRIEESRRSGHTAQAPPPGAASDGSGDGAGGGVSMVPRQLPTTTSHFVGRAAEFEALSELVEQPLDAGTVVISAVAGMAGIGKTALAVYVGHRLADRFPDGQLFVDLRGFTAGIAPMQAGQALGRLLRDIGVPDQRIPSELDERAALWRSVLAGRRMLIVLDNARDTAQVRPLLPGAPTCLVLVTSRNQLSGLVAADGAHPITLDLLTDAEAHHLLTRRLGADRVAAAPDAITEIITACARLPLALAIVAARAATEAHLPLHTLAERLHNNNSSSSSSSRLDTLRTDDPATDVRAVFSWSYQALTVSAARLFRLLGLHPGPDTSAAAAASLAALSVSEARGLLGELTRANLLIEHLPGRYTFHDLLRAYATDLAHRLESDQQRHAATHRILDHYLHTAHTADPLLQPHRDPITLTPPQPGVIPEHPADAQQALDWFTTEHPVLLAAVDHAAANGLDTHTWQLAWTLDTFLDRRGHWHDWAATQKAAVAAAGRQVNPTAQARAHRNLAGAYSRVGRLDDAHTQLRHVLDFYTQAGDLAGQAHTHLTLSQVWDWQGRHAEALHHDRQALDLYQTAGHRVGQARALNGIG